MNEQLTEKSFKRHVAYKLRIGQILQGNQVFEEAKLKYIEADGKKISRVNLIANVVDKFSQDGEKKYGSLMLDDATGQIAVKFFGDGVAQLEEFQQGDTLLVIGLLRSWQNQAYITPEIIKKKDPEYLLVRKLEIEAEQKPSLSREKVAALKDNILTMIKNSEESGGLEIEKIILELKESPENINKEIRRLLEDGMVYEPRPGKLRYLG